MTDKPDNSGEDLEGTTRREFLKIAGGAGAGSLLAKLGLISSTGIAVASCLGGFGLVRLNNAPDYDSYASNEDIRKIHFAYLNAADLRGDTPNLWAIVSRKKILRRAKWLASYSRTNRFDFLGLSEVDYKDTLKTGCVNQPQAIAKYMGTPYDYVIFDEYAKSSGWTTGKAVVSRFPMKPIYRHVYGKKNGFFGRFRHVFKDFIHVGSKVGRRKLDIINNHFYDGYESVKMDEAKQLLAYATKLMKEDPNRFMVAPGDYNSTHDSNVMTKILSTGVFFPPAVNFGLKTYRSSNPYSDIDHILANQNLKITDFRTFHFPWSDHLGVECMLEFKH
ncbi:MAG: endonuclease/exonuclease/phosphatase family protein [Nanoarchaeota archaeon]